MKRKIFVMMVAIVLGTAVLAVGNVRADAESIRGFAIANDPNDEFYEDSNVQWLDDEEHAGRITVINVDEPDQDTDMGMMADYAMNQDGRGTEFSEEYDSFSWAPGGAHHPVGWVDEPSTGDNIIFLAEYDGIEDGLDNSYVFAAHLEADGENLPDDAQELCLRYEPIPVPELNNEDGEPVGRDYVNISMENFKYTDYNMADDVVEERGTFHTFESYAVYINGGEFSDWTYIGNSQQDPNRPQVDEPLPATGDDTDPTTIDTGAHYFNSTGLDGGQYEFRIAPQFGAIGEDYDPVWGPVYEDGEEGGAVCSFVQGAASETFDTPEFGPGILVPVVATIGLFTVIAIYRKKMK